MLLVPAMLEDGGSTSELDGSWDLEEETVSVPEVAEDDSALTLEVPTQPWLEPPESVRPPKYCGGSEESWSDGMQEMKDKPAPAKPMNQWVMHRARGRLGTSVLTGMGNLLMPEGESSLAPTIMNSNRTESVWVF